MPVTLLQHCCSRSSQLGHGRCRWRFATMGGSRHSKNAGTMGSESQTYHERKALGYGTVRERLGKVRLPLHETALLPLCAVAVACAAIQLQATDHRLLFVGRCRQLRRLPSHAAASAGKCVSKRQPSCLMHTPRFSHIPLAQAVVTTFAMAADPSCVPQDPMCTPAGVVFSREAILENLLAQKKANKRKLAAWEAQQQTLNREVRVACTPLSYVSTASRNASTHKVAAWEAQQGSLAGRGALRKWHTETMSACWRLQ